MFRDRVAKAAISRDVVRLRGADALAFVQGQLSQDVEAIAPGTSAWSLLLQPQGRVDAWLRLVRTPGGEIVLDVDAGWGEAVAARLARFKLRVDVELELETRTGVALRGPAGADLPPPPEGTLALDPAWPGIAGLDVLGADLAWPPEVPEADSGALEALRIECGVPAMGAELDERTIPAEAGIVDRSVSFTKGCYTGQELVARIDSRGGNVPRRLRGLVMEEEEVPPVGASIRWSGEEVGAVTSSASSDHLGRPIALGYVARRVEVPSEATVFWDGGQGVAELRALPLVS